MRFGRSCCDFKIKNIRIAQIFFLPVDVCILSEKKNIAVCIKDGQIQEEKKICAILMFLILKSQHKKKVFSKKRIWIKPWIARRAEKDYYCNLFLELQLENPNKYRRCLRITSNMFEKLVEKLDSLIKRQDTHLRKNISSAERFAVTLRHLATGESQESLSYNFRMGQSTISGIIKDTCRALISILQEKHLKFPDSELSWKVIANDYMERWNFPNCLGTMDGKHCRVDPPLQSGSSYYNYKETFSIVLLGLVDAQLRFIYVDVGTNGRVSNKGIWNKCTLKHHLQKNDINIPPPSPLPGTEHTFPYVIIGDEGFALSTNVLILYPKKQCVNKKERRIYNYRLSRARRCSENAFGVMVSRFNILRSPMRYDPDDARCIELAICCLHNMLRSDSIGRKMYTPPRYIDMENEMTGQLQYGDWRNDQGIGLLRLQHQGGNRHATTAIEMRETLCEYFNNIGQVPWQDQSVQ